MGEADAAPLGTLLKTGDLVLFGSDAWLAGLIRRFVRGRWSHVGMVLRGADATVPLLWEATPPDGGRHGGQGTRVVPLLERVLDFPGEVSLRPLGRALSVAQCEALVALRPELAARGAKRSLLDLMGAADDGWIGAAPDHLGAPLAAQLVAEAYQRIGLLDDVRHGGLPAGDYAPRDFAPGGRAELKSGFGLGPEIPLRSNVRAAGWAGLKPQTA
jgi:hypothetical protein